MTGAPSFTNTETRAKDKRRKALETARRNTIYHLRCEILHLAMLEGEHCRLRFKAPEIAAAALPGQFVNVRYPGGIPETVAFQTYAELIEHHRHKPPAEPPFLLARPFGVHRVDTDAGCVEILFKMVGRGTRLLAQAGAGADLDVLGPIGNSFNLVPPPQTAVLVAGGTGIAPLYLLARRLHGAGSKLVVLVGTGHAIPMTVSDSEEVVHFLDEDVTAVIDDYVALGAVVRIATIKPRKGCLTGTAIDLFSGYLKSLKPGEHAGKQIFSCGPWAMQARVAELAKQAGITCQVLLEERMGCGLGACMACVCKVKQDSGEFKNKRVCVDGPVFRAEDIGWNQRD